MGVFLQAMAEAFGMGVALRSAAYRRGWFKVRRLSRPVVSVGNLTVGGTGKTPLVAYLARRFAERGWRPSILTRGYHSHSRATPIVLEPDAERAPDPREVGDEPALLARWLPEVPIVVSAGRYQAGRLAEERFDVDVHLLDDGFQHWSLARDVDLVLVDATQRLSGCALLPAGRFREPCAALTRAHVVLITRTELADPAPWEDQVRRIHPQAQVFHSATRLCGLMEVATGKVLAPAALQGKPVYAFCGIGNHKAFFADVSAWGFSLVGKASFGDHYAYPNNRLAVFDADLSALSPPPGAFVTTEKDAIKLRGSAALHRQIDRMGIPVLACVTRMEIREPEAFEHALLARVEAHGAANRVE